jgi:hypothetical protein
VTLAAGWRAWLLWLCSIALIGGCVFEMVDLVIVGSRAPVLWGLGGFALSAIVTGVGGSLAAARWMRSHPDRVERGRFTPAGLARTRLQRTRTGRGGGITAIATGAFAVFAANAPEPQRTAVLGVCAGFFLVLFPVAWWAGRHGTRNGPSEGSDLDYPARSGAQHDSGT